MVCRDAHTHLAREVNSLIISSPEEQALFTMGEGLWPCSEVAMAASDRLIVKLRSNEDSPWLSVRYRVFLLAHQKPRICTRFI
jgi:hypothetical protein